MSAFAINERFGKWTVVGRTSGRIVKKHNGHVVLHYVPCRCDCGTERLVYGANLLNGRSRSCGCRIGPATSSRSLIHGASRTPEYKCWLDIIQRCENPKDTAYRHYGGRGITLCQKWRESFPAFLADVGLKPSPELTLDRIDNDGNYEPGNVRWATRSQQMFNRHRKAVALPSQERSDGR